jgi:hypothetical protein
MITAFDDSYINKETLAAINQEYKKCLVELNGYIKYLKSAKENLSNSISKTQ